MKVSIITCHNVYNFGASLQCYALMKFLSEKGHNVSIIDYRPAYLNNHFSFSAIGNPVWEKSIVRRVIYRALKFPRRLILLKRKVNFDKFTKRYLKLSESRYVSFNQLREHPPIADIYICGSDQIWNSVFENGRDPAFYLQFAPIGSTKVSYAASFGTDYLVEGSKKLVVSSLKEFSAISVREVSGVKILNSIGIYNVEKVLDPVFLLKRYQWEEMVIKSRYNNKFVLVYDFDNSNIIKNISEKIASYENLKIYSLNKLNYVHRSFELYGPEEFIGLIKNAEYIVTNSFHAVAFSLIFNKSFWVVRRKEKLLSLIHI